jgi:glycerol-3-phosphate O-acyltransferase/dihydroxyacetone phosphate acyltransferase
VIAVARFVSARKQAKALAKSSVKVEARDVVATWKLMVSLVMVPCLHLFYGLMVRLLVDAKWSVVFFFLAPFAAMGSVLAFERSQKVFVSIRPLVNALINSSSVDVVKARKELQEDVRSTVQVRVFQRSRFASSSSPY